MKGMKEEGKQKRKTELKAWPLGCGWVGGDSGAQRVPSSGRGAYYKDRRSKMCEGNTS